MSATLWVSRLRLTNFRCYAQARIDPVPGPVVLTGPNGAGKTNLLEALSLLAPGRGLRRARLEDLARRGVPETPAEPQGWAVAATIETPDGAVDIGTGHNPQESRRRAVRVNDAAARSQTALGDHVSAVWLTPQMDRLFIEGAAGRRRFLDRLVFGIDPKHAGRISAYDHALRERARLLQDGVADRAWLDTLERTLAERGVAIAAARREMTARLAGLCEAPLGPFPGARLVLTGTVESWLDDGPALAAEDKLQHGLQESRGRDAITGGAAIGPHRSDFTMHHLGNGMPADQCSTGEQKALLIAIVLANARLETAERDRAPLLLLDEVAAHLDVERREALFAELLNLGAQAWLTGTDSAIFQSLAGTAQFLAVSDGVIRDAEHNSGATPPHAR